MHLLLFDIDGTLVRVNEVGREALTNALSSLTGRPISTEAISFSGRTDPDIFEAILAHNDLPITDQAVRRAIDAYVDAVRDTLTSDSVSLLPGVRPLLARLHEETDVHLGLVTGNVESIAHEKLAVHDLIDYFPFGAYGSDHADRNQLPTLAARRAAQHTGRSFQLADHVTIIGDTVHDIRCARSAGARAVAVCTGRYDRDELSAEQPDLLLDTLEPADTLVQQLLQN